MTFHCGEPITILLIFGMEQQGIGEVNLIDS